MATDTRPADTLAALLDAYVDGAARLRRDTAGLTRDQATARPVPGKWSTLECVCHLADFEPIFALRIKLTVAHDRPALSGVDEKPLAGALHYQERDLDEEVALIDLTRRTTARALRGYSDAVLARASSFQDGGRTEERTLRDYLTKANNHLDHHLRFVREKRKALGLS